MLEWSIRTVELPLKYTWNIARNKSDVKTNLLVTVTDGIATGTGEAAPNIRYNETPQGLLEEFHRLPVPGPILSHSEFDHELDRLPVSNALRFSIESAYLHFLSARQKIPVEQFLQLPAPAPVHTAYTVPILEPGAIASFYREHRLERFKYIKLKVGRTAPLETVRELAACCPQPMMIDANEAFADAADCIRWMEKIRQHAIVFVEQPLPAGNTEEIAEIKKHSPFPLVADESITSHPDFPVLCRGFHGINMKLMKAGGYLRGAAILQEARRHGLFTLIGCMVETTLGISSALRLSSLADYIDLDSFLLLKEEPFGLVKEEAGALSLVSPAPST